AGAQYERLPELSQIEPLPPAEGEMIAPGQSYFDYDAWTAAGAGPTNATGDWEWQILPEGIIYQAYLANPKESRLGTQVFEQTGDGQFLWDSTLGGHVGLLRYGTCDGIWPQGWQFDVEGNTNVRLNPDNERDLDAADFRIGAPITYGYARHRLKFGYYHLSSHIGDEFLIRNPGFTRLNFVRETLILGYAYFATDNLRLYAEAGWAFITDVCEPWELQFGFDYAPSRPTGIRGAPFVAFNTHLREELDFSGNFVVQAGWAWRGDRSTHLFRIGLHYYNGASNLFEFYNTFEQQIGGGVWYDF
ncbi:MAG TPA: DUF1207 domain-containing protein, partial [Pirellulaceae bacterium]|nr:DUF1207 domain-containing protein [Pirellulaceae bacterium]